jgi:hypothetical protein
MMANLKSVAALLLLLPLIANAQSEDIQINTKDPIFWVKIVVIIILVILSGIVAGTDTGSPVKGVTYSLFLKAIFSNTINDGI